jgi:hypothetical protein
MEQRMGKEENHTQSGNLDLILEQNKDVMQ